MIIGCHRPLQVGVRLCDTISDSERVYHRNTPYLVLRESTFQEWKEQAEEDGLILTPLEMSHRDSGAYFYEISVD